MRFQVSLLLTDTGPLLGRRRVTARGGSQTRGQPEDQPLVLAYWGKRGLGNLQQICMFRRRRGRSLKTFLQQSAALNSVGRLQFLALKFLLSCSLGRGALTCCICTRLRATSESIPLQRATSDMGNSVKSANPMGFGYFLYQCNYLDG